MGAIASLEDLQKLNLEITAIHAKYPEASKQIANSMRQNSSLGYKNYCRLFTGRSTPEELKSGTRGGAKKSSSSANPNNILEDLINGNRLNAKLNQE